MAHKVSPYVNRLGYNSDWNVFFLPKTKQERSNWLLVNKLINDYLFSIFPDIIKLKIDYSSNFLFIYIHITEILLSKEELDKIPKKIESIVFSNNFLKNPSVKVSLFEVKNIYSDAQSIANIIAKQMDQRISARIFLRKIMSKILFERDVKGVKVEMKGRLDGSEISQKKKFLEGTVPFSTFDEEVSFGFKEVITTYGLVGIKVTLCKKKKNW